VAVLREYGLNTGGNKPLENPKEDTKMWTQGQIAALESNTIYTYWAKVFDEGSEHGINEGRISKLTIRKQGETRDLYNFDRGLDLPPANEEVETVLNTILAKYS